MKKKQKQPAKTSRPVRNRRPSGQRRELSKREYIQAENAKRHRRQRKRRQRFVVVLLLLFVLASAAVITSAAFFKITTVQVVGDPGTYSTDQIIGTSGIVSGDNMFSFKAGTVENSIEAAFPKIENVTVKRKLPSVVEISVEQAQPSRAFQDANGTYTVISARNKIIETGATKPEGAMEIRGIDLQNISAGQYLDSSLFPDLDTLTQITDALTQWGIEGIQAIDLSDKFNVKIQYNEKVTISIGSISQISYKIQFAKYVIDNGLKENETVLIDASTPGQAVVKPVDTSQSTTSSDSSSQTASSTESHAEQSQSQENSSVASES